MEQIRSPLERDEGRRGDLELGSTPRMLRLVAARQGERLAVRDGDVTLTYAALAEEVRCVAAAMLARGIAHGDRVGIWAPNVHEWIVAMLATHSVGGVLVPINTRFRGEEAAYVLEKSGARLLFTIGSFLGTDYLGMLRGCGKPLPALDTIVVLRGEGSGAVGWNVFREVSELRAADARAERVGPDDLSDLIFTSGTTGHPKGVLCTHGQSLRAFRDWADIVGLREDDRYLVVAPFFHTFGYKAGILAALMTGASIHPQPTFDADSVLARIAAEKITVIPGPPTLYQSLLARDRSGFDLSSLRLAVTGAAVIPVDLVHRMRDELGFRTVLTGYGLTEATGVSTLCRDGDEPETIAFTSGRAVPGVEVRVVDEQGKEVPRGEPGEVVVRGYTVMRGYDGDPEATAATIDADGFLHTGDVGVMDGQGNLRITDRIKDMFIVGGFNVYPAEIEQALARHPAVAQVSVVGVPEERLGEVGKAFVVLKSGASLTLDELTAWAREKMANYKVPRQLAVVDALPMNASGKVLKYRLRGGG